MLTASLLFWRLGRSSVFQLLVLLGALSLCIAACEKPRSHHDVGTASAPPSSTLAPVASSESARDAGLVGVRRLPDPERAPEVNRTLDLIERGGPFPYRQDGVVFENREGRLPKKPRGYYHEYTVRTPSAPNRGTRRLITGQQGDVYYTDDHYRTFVPIDPKRY